MNCPGACLVFGSTRHSYRELPLRLAEFGQVFRAEREGVLHGLLRVRSFVQDDAHIYCTEDQIARRGAGRSARRSTSSMSASASTDVRVELSTRPEKSIGTEEQWERAEAALEGALEQMGREYQLNPGDGAFYGPKIDFHVTDALGRSWQLGTCQLDFFMPERFDLSYTGADNAEHRPVMIHRALLGSMERFVGILIEHHAGRFPLWLAPVQAGVLPVADRHADYARQVAAQLREAGVARACGRALRVGRPQDQRRRARQVALHARRRRRRAAAREASRSAPTTRAIRASCRSHSSPPNCAKASRADEVPYTLGVMPGTQTTTRR